MSRQTLYEQARKEDKTITVKSVKDWYQTNMEKQDIMVVRTRAWHRMQIMNIKLIYVL